MISCKEYAAIKKDRIKNEIEKEQLNLSLDIFQIGDNPASNSYIKGKLADCTEVGIHTEVIKLPENIGSQSH